MYTCITYSLQDGETSKTLKVAAAVSAHYVIKPSKAGSKALLMKGLVTRPEIVADEGSGFTYIDTYDSHIILYKYVYV